MKKIIFLISLTLVSCGTTMNTVLPERLTENDVILEKEYTKEIGSPLVTKGDFLQQKALKITNMKSFNIGMMKFPYSIGEKLPLNGQNESYFFYYDKNKSRDNTYQVGISENKKTGEFKSFVNSYSGGIYTKDIPEFEYETTQFTPDDCDKCFKQEFIYNGRVNNDLKFVYREYVDNLARSSFTQELQYDINDSNIIGFKGLRIEVLNTTNTSITYKVLSPFE
ncbi:hypothetical protein [Yeosuana sp.]|uniref:hypothetical protein n=1 Tax=Yeosuana sp. TaxID=2529388 RepID=UPI004054A25C